jgi:hypothetical protein
MTIAHSAASSASHAAHLNGSGQTAARASDLVSNQTLIKWLRDMS